MELKEYTETGRIVIFISLIKLKIAAVHKIYMKIMCWEFLENIFDVFRIFKHYFCKKHNMKHYVFSNMTFFLNL